MNRHTTPPQTNPPYTNGHYETPLELSGVSLRPPAPVQKLTVFPSDLPIKGTSALLYALHRFEVGGLPLSRYIAALWVGIALLAGLGIIPGRWFTVAISLLLLAGQIALAIRFQKQKYVTFASASLPILNHEPLAISEKLPIYATGLLSVEGRYRAYSALPGFYRTFATGEHAVLCRVPERSWLGVAGWPQDETGMWYAFIHPTDIERITWGNLSFGVTTYPALAVEYRLEIPPSPRRKQPEVRLETIYIAAPDMHDAQRLYVDLLSNLPSEKIGTSLATGNLHPPIT